MDPEFVEELLIRLQAQADVLAAKKRKSGAEQSRQSGRTRTVTIIEDADVD